MRKFDFKNFSKLVALDEYGRTFDKSIDDWDEKYNIYVNLCDTAIPPYEKNSEELKCSFLVIENYNITDLIEKSNIIGNYIKKVFLPNYYKNCQYTDSETDIMIDLKKLSFFGHMKFFNRIKVLTRTRDYSFAEIEYLFSISSGSENVEMVSKPIIKIMSKEKTQKIYDALKQGW